MNNRSPAVIGLTAVALLASLSLSATATTHSSPTTHAAASASTWGPYYSPGGKRARASGMITPIGENHETLPSAATLTVSGTVSDLTRGSACGWAVFGIATINAAGTRVAWTHHPVRTCAFRAAKKFSFTYHRVYQVDLKVCSERRASKPSIQCTAGNPAWRTLYTSPH
ncbi:hypothetical protein AB0M50_31015 [Nonomuraea fuscirosea]|uniref:hypothetical protein n=1 Tax=Nonomuraea fuscirosea TaxID=1291556 RepID=UPI00344347CE